MRAADGRAGELFAYVDLERRVPAEHPLRVIRAVVNAALGELSGALGQLYARLGRPSIPPDYPSDLHRDPVWAEAGRESWDAGAGRGDRIASDP